MRRKYVIGALALTATLAALILQISSSPQPSFKGKGLSEWVRGYEGNARHADVDEAMRQMGTNSLPILLRMVGEAEWSVVAKRKVFNFGQKLHLVKSDQTPLRFSREAAGEAISALGPDAKDVVPVLVKMYERGHSDEQVIMRVLASIGPPASNALPIILRATTNKDSGTRANAIVALRNLKVQPAISVPVLIKALDDDYYLVVVDALWGLGEAGIEANVAIPAILPLLKSTNNVLPKAASDALNQIDPEAAKAAGVWAPWAANK